MKPWVENSNWFERYALGSATLKYLGRDPDKPLSEISKSIKATFARVYRAVAFDIDGTLTEMNKIEINKDMALVVGRLLQRGVPVVLITGRGRTSTRKAASKIREYSGLSDWYLRRLQCITHNGVFLLQTPPDNPSAFLERESFIEPVEQHIPALLEAVHRYINQSGVDLSKVTVSPEPNSIRITLQSQQELPRLEKVLRKLVLEVRKKGGKLYLSRGSYANLNCLDLSGTNKQLALAHFADALGIEPGRILRIGDQGQEGGNDFDLLNSDAGFSVGEFSSKLTRCHPVLDEDLQTQLRGVQATHRLLNIVLLFPSLSIAPTPEEIRVRDHRTFEKLAIIRSREETETVTQRLRVRLRYLLPDSAGFANSHTIEISDIYDMRSGGVKLREWELDDLPDNHYVLRLFDVPVMRPKNNQISGSRWCMYTDTGILMRGPNYYFGQTTPSDERNLPRYLEIAKTFIIDAAKVAHLLSQEDANLTRYKFALAIHDNVRNLLLQLLYAAFVIEGVTSNEYEITRRLFKKAVLPHTQQHFDLLLNADADWSTLLASYRNLLLRLKEIFNHLEQSLIPKFEKLRSSKKLRSIGQLFKWRECDHFLQNITAVQLGLHELRQRTEIRDAKRLAVVGLAYGGIELPAIAHVVAQSRGFKLETALAKVSIYGDREASQKIRAGKYQYVTELLDKTKPLCLIDNPESGIEGMEFILMDDNCTTGVTLQLARDFLVMQEADVVGAIVVRFPGVNRSAQMSMQGHGFPDPEVLFSFIRGLVAPSPYTRLIYPRRGKDPYLDQTGIFDKAKDRIARYLKKNGTPVVK